MFSDAPFEQKKKVFLGPFIVLLQLPMERDKEWQEITAGILGQYTLFDRMVDSSIGAYSTSGNRIYCGKGCCGCCTLAVNCTYAEARCMAESLTDAQTERIREHAGQLMHQMAEITDLKSYLRMQRKVMGLCPLIGEDDTCGVYDRRPFSCRALLSTKENRWCSTDFAELTSGDKAAFIDSLDRSAVAFPMHYLAQSQDLGQQFESRAALTLAAHFGFTVSGNLRFLLFLEKEFCLSALFAEGYEATLNFLKQKKLYHPLLLMAEKI